MYVHACAHIYVYVCMYVCRKKENLLYEIVVIKRNAICCLGFEELAEGPRNNSGDLATRTRCYL